MFKVFALLSEEGLGAGALFPKGTNTSGPQGPWSY